MGSLAAVAVILLLLIALALYGIPRLGRGKGASANSDNSIKDFARASAPPRKAGESRNPAIFISYRREDSANARLVYERLSSRFGSANIFMDIDTLTPGEDFVRAVEGTLSSCDALVAVIGRGWTAQTGALTNAKDFVRIEITAALQRGILVLPVLVDGVSMPETESLPEDMKELAERQALPVVDTYFEEGMNRLLGALVKAKAANQGS